MSHYSRLTQEQRYILGAMKRNGASKKEIAAAIGKHPSTVSREFRRAGMTSGSYCFVAAQEHAQSSGVGKSTLVNQLYSEDWQWTSEVNEITGKGRHTTTSRELVPLRNGGMLIDNPGMREIQMWTDEATLRDSFADVEALTAECKFSDCSHRKDAKCGIRAAVEAGTLDPTRYENFLNLENEIAALKKRSEKR
jgi:putative ribosome biogenesis GTPase RsgA